MEANGLKMGVADMVGRVESSESEREREEDKGREGEEGLRGKYGRGRKDK